MSMITQGIGLPPPWPVLLMEFLIEEARRAAARGAAARAVAARRRHRAPRRGLTLRPGVDTPLWNELVRQVRPHLRKRGSKAQLARLLGLPRQRLHDCLKARSACLDGERTLLLVGWLGYFQRGGTITPGVRPGRPARRAAKSPVPGNL
jgi:hypothetical protein